MTSKLPLVVAFVLVFAFALMLVAFRSIVVAAKAIVLNLLSVAAAYGVLVLVFQHGFGKGLLGFSSTAGIDPVVPLLLFVILFGLSMDYHVLVLSRIRERFQRGATMDEAISHGIKSTAGVVTSAAIVMVGVFAVFATLSMLMFKQFGVGLAAAILIDATIVRGVLLPATMKLLGELELVPPRVARVAAAARRRRVAGSCEGRARLRLRLTTHPVRPRAARGRGRPSKGTHAMTASNRPSPPPGSSRSRSSARRCSASPTSASPPAATPVSVPKGAQAGQLTLHPCTLRHRAGQLRRRLRHARRPREPGRPAARG